MSIMDNLFQRTLDDLIKGFRLHLLAESSFLSKSMNEIRRELKSTDLDTKSIALQKLTYLNSIHAIDMSFAAFHVVELMGSSVFLHKKIAYLAASQSFHDATDVILLITNQLRKDLTGGNEFEVCLALECLSKIATADLARDLTPEVFTLLASSKIHVRKKAIGVVLRLFSKYADAVRVCFKRLVENLDNADPQTVSSTVGVFCELTCQDPKAYLPLAPEFYRVLVDSKNNWVLIKILKIFSKLVPLEPRLAKKVVEPICEHMRRTGAKSLMFECVRTIVTSLAEYESAVKLAVEKIRELLIDEDPNLKYLGLQGLAVVAQNNLWAVLENKEMVIKSLSDSDPNIRLESLRLVMAMVSEDNVVEISRVLVNYALKSDPEFCNEILGYILFTCYRNDYEIIMDFDWYVNLLGEIARIPQCQRGEDIENQLIDIALRVKDVRPQLVRVGRDLLIDPALLGNHFIHRILSAAAWICGEFIEFSKDPLELMEALVQPRASLLPPTIRAVYVHSCLKILNFCANYYMSKKEPFTSELPDRLIPESAYQLADEFSLQTANDTAVSLVELSSLISLGMETTQQTLSNLVNLVEKSISPLLACCEVELLERARNVHAFTLLIKQGLLGSAPQGETNMEEDTEKHFNIIKSMQDALCEELSPVSTGAQSRVLKPDGLILEEDLSKLEIICGDLQFPLPTTFSLVASKSRERILTSSNLQDKGDLLSSNETTSLLVEHRKRHGLYYLPSVNTDTSTDDYPPANISTSGDIFNDEAVDLAKITERSLGSKKKPTHPKPRPVVIKLDQRDEVPDISKISSSKDDTLSGVVRDVLHGAESVCSSLQGNMSASSSKSKLKDKISFPPSEDNTYVGNPDTRKSSTRRSNSSSHGKERRLKSPEKSKENKPKDRSGKRYGKRNSQKITDEPLSEASPTPVIPDFLL